MSKISNLTFDQAIQVAKKGGIQMYQGESKEETKGLVYTVDAETGALTGRSKRGIEYSSTKLIGGVPFSWEQMNASDWTVEAILNPTHVDGESIQATEESEAEDKKSLEHFHLATDHLLAPTPEAPKKSKAKAAETTENTQAPDPAADAVVDPTV